MRGFRVRPTDKGGLAEQVQGKIDNLNKPKGSLGRLEELALQVGLVQHTDAPVLRNPWHVLFGADHGIEREGVSVSPREVTWQQMRNFARGGGGVNMFCRQHGFGLRLVDVGVDGDFPEEMKEGAAREDKRLLALIADRKIAYGTADFCREPAMSESEFDRAVEIGVEMVDGCRAQGCNVVSFGEMGIGNTSPSSVWMCLLGGIPLDLCVGAGAGLDTEGVRRKYEVLCRSIDCFRASTRQDVRVPMAAPQGWTMGGGRASAPCTKDEVTAILRWFGGFEMVAATGAMLRAAEYGMLVLVDGFIMTACMLAASCLFPAVLDYAVFAHQGDEAGHRMLLEAMGARPLLHLGLRLGEGTGAICAYPLVQSAVNMLTQMDNFQHAAVTKYF